MIWIIWAIAGLIVGFLVWNWYRSQIWNVAIIIDDRGNIIKKKKSRKDYVEFFGKTFHFIGEPHYIKGNKRFYIFKYSDAKPLRLVEEKRKISPSLLYSIVKTISLSRILDLQNYFFALMLLVIIAIISSIASAYLSYNLQQQVVTLKGMVKKAITVVTPK